MAACSALEGGEVIERKIKREIKGHATARQGVDAAAILECAADRTLAAAGLPEPGCWSPPPTSPRLVTQATTEQSKDSWLSLHPSENPKE
ncbi:hypothetical protein ZWY2020_015065 [Hordeum vulgare]|nr:hypothetical protein ZWY2020_015065 [Hordeum vulgare]